MAFGENREELATQFALRTERLLSMHRGHSLPPCYRGDPSDPLRYFLRLETPPPFEFPPRRRGNNGSYEHVPVPARRRSPTSDDGEVDQEESSEDWSDGESTDADVEMVTRESDDESENDAEQAHSSATNTNDHDVIDLTMEDDEDEDDRAEVADAPQPLPQIAKASPTRRPKARGRAHSDADSGEGAKAVTAVRRSQRARHPPRRADEPVSFAAHLRR